MPFAPPTSLLEQVDAATSLWRQGDVVDIGAAPWLAYPQSPLTQQADDAAGDDLSCVVAAVDQLVVVSQTCDVVRTCATRPHLLLARVVTLEEPSASEARRGSRPRFVPLPGLGDRAFADLDLVVTAEKTALLGRTPVRGLTDERSQRRFGAGVARVFGRFAFPDDLSVALRGLILRVRAKHDKASSEGAALAALEEIRVTGTPAWDSGQIDVFLTFAPPDRAAADAVMPEQQWDEVVDEWLRRAEPFGVIASVDGAMIPLDELTAREYLDSDALDLDYLSWSQA